MSAANQVELNKGDNIIVLIDVSGSMGIKDAGGKDGKEGTEERLSFSKEKTKVITLGALQWDTDGVDGFTFGSRVTSLGKLTKENVDGILAGLKANEGSTQTHLAIQEAWKAHRAGNYAQTVAFLITDGEPADEDAVFTTIAGITQELKNEHEFALSFLTAGVRSEGLQKFLVKLDDALPGAKHDIVDVKYLEEVDFESAFAGALHD